MKKGQAMLYGHRQFCIWDRNRRFLQRHCKRHKEEIWYKEILDDNGPLPIRQKEKSCKHDER